MAGVAESERHRLPQGSGSRLAHGAGGRGSRGRPALGFRPGKKPQGWEVPHGHSQPLPHPCPNLSSCKPNWQTPATKDLNGRNSSKGQGGVRKNRCPRAGEMPDSTEPNCPRGVEGKTKPAQSRSIFFSINPGKHSAYL